MMRTLLLALAVAAAAVLGGCRSDIETIRHLDTTPPAKPAQAPAA
jgi:hypothetical protein